MDMDGLTDYTPLTYPATADGVSTYITDELTKIGDALNALTAVVRLLENRIAALEP